MATEITHSQIFIMHGDWTASRATAEEGEEQKRQDQDCKNVRATTSTHPH